MSPPAITARDAHTGHPILLSLAFRIRNDLICLAEPSGPADRIAFDADGGEMVVDSVEEGGFVEAHDHAGEVVGGEAGEGVFDELFGGDDGVLHIADKVDRFLVGADVPELKYHR